MSEKKFDYIGTFTDVQFHFMDPSEDEVCIEDIAQALSNLCRYSGHVSKQTRMGAIACDGAATAIRLAEEPELTMTA